MKKMCLVVVLVIAAVSMVSAMQFGVRGGIVMSKFTEDIEGIEPGVNTGLTAGLCMHMPLPAMENLVIIGEANYVQKGSKYEEEGDEIFINTDYIELAAMGKFMVNDFIGIYAGPVWAFLSKAEIEFKGYGTEDIKDYMKSSEMSLNVGAQVGFGPLFVDGRYNLGLSDNNDDFIESSMEAKTRTFSFTVGYLF